MFSDKKKIMVFAVVFAVALLLLTTANSFM